MRRVVYLAKAREFRQYAEAPSRAVYAAADALEARAESLREEARRLRRLGDVRLAVELEKSVGEMAR